MDREKELQETRSEIQAVNTEIECKKQEYERRYEEKLTTARDLCTHLSQFKQCVRDKLENDQKRKC